ncbi:pachytene checkpoint 2 protein isoform X2 [Oratosquilla oratoria]|uniref:pachytene checkpoint 2 protein isoform X2 n=1 Tax=Oratosquilla oratoria TaxID=337810 RepID=UPI003F7603FF
MASAIDLVHSTAGMSNEVSHHASGYPDFEVPENLKKNVHVEIMKKIRSKWPKDLIIETVKDMMLNGDRTIKLENTITEFSNPALKEHIHVIKVCELDDSSETTTIHVNFARLHFYVYHMENGGPDVEELDGDGNDSPAATQWLLPSTDFYNLWETLIYDEDIKGKLLNFVSTTMLFSDRNVDSNLIAWNKVVLLHGPPGTGKTSLCKALAQKLSIRLEGRYKQGQLIEINSHSLFSKWFSESGKLVQKMFDKITELVEDPQSFVCVLIDEVESLTQSRTATSGTDPADALRVVNALLTQLDQIKRYPNVLILTTSNVSGTIDLAFVDRADIKQHIGLPSPVAIYYIYHSCIKELMKKGVIAPRETILTYKELKAVDFANNETTTLSSELWKTSRRSEGLSGRTLRKIPFLAHAMYVQSSSSNLSTFLFAMMRAVEQQFEDREKLELMSL